MTMTEYLKQAYRLEQRIDSKLEQVEALRCLATKSTAIIRQDSFGGGGDGNFMEDAIIRIVDTEREIGDEIGRLVDLKRKIGEMISRVEDPELQTLLELRYLCYKGWPEIAEILHRGKTYVYELHRKALICLEEGQGDRSKTEESEQTRKKKL